MNSKKDVKRHGPTMVEGDITVDFVSEMRPTCTGFGTGRIRTKSVMLFTALT
jgi:hypothetical protein